MSTVGSWADPEPPAMGSNSTLYSLDVQIWLAGSVDPQAGQCRWGAAWLPFLPREAIPLTRITHRDVGVGGMGKGWRKARYPSQSPLSFLEGKWLRPW